MCAAASAAPGTAPNALIADRGYDDDNHRRLL
jgi:hypothetical protein